MRFSSVIRTAYDRIAAALVRRFARAKQRPYLEYCFSGMGRISKSCGRVTEAHIDYAEALMARFGFGRRDRRAAIGWFRAGRADSVNFHQLATACATSHQPALAEIVVECLIHTAEIERCPAANRTLKLLASLLRVDNETLVGKQQKVVQASEEIASARTLLGVAADADAATIKQAYRALASRHHPDKLPPDATQAQIDTAQQQTVAARDAYERLINDAT